MFGGNGIDIKSSRMKKKVENNIQKPLQKLENKIILNINKGTL